MSRFKTKSFSSQITFAIFIVFFLCLLIVSGTHLMYTYKTSKQINEKLVHDQLVNLTAGFKENIEALRRDVRFLSSTPPIEGIIRATKGKGKDAVDGSSLKQWKDRLAVIFKEMLIVHPDYQQIRFIGVENEGKELVRVDWNQRRLERTSEKLLQVKGNEAYFKEALKTPVNKVYLSEFSLNREWGKVVEPLQLVIRAAVPIGDEEN